MGLLRKGIGITFDQLEPHRSCLISYGCTMCQDPTIVKDGIQDIFLRLVESGKSFDEIDDLESYLKVSLRNSILKEKKFQSNMVNDPKTKLFDMAIPSYEDHLINIQQTLEDKQRVKNLFQQITTSQKTILTMRFYRNMSYDDIAHKLDITKRTVYNQVQDAMKKLRSV